MGNCTQRLGFASGGALEFVPPGTNAG